MTVLVLLALLGACSPPAAKNPDTSKTTVKPGAYDLQRTPPWVDVAEANFRRSALKNPIPQYPERSLAAGTSGVSVARVTAGLDGAIENVQVLEAPDEYIAAAMRQALDKWVVRPTQVTGAPGKSKRRARVTFYFRIDRGNPLVLSPEQALAGLPVPHR